MYELLVEQGPMYLSVGKMPTLERLKPFCAALDTQMIAWVIRDGGGALVEPFSQAHVKKLEREIQARKAAFVKTKATMENWEMWEWRWWYE